MAMYEYRCLKCGQTFEQIVRSAPAAHSLTCPTCGSRRVKRQIARFAVARGDAGAATRDERSCACGQACRCNAR